MTSVMNVGSFGRFVFLFAVGTAACAWGNWPRVVATNGDPSARGGCCSACNTDTGHCHTSTTCTAGTYREITDNGGGTFVKESGTPCGATSCDQNAKAGDEGCNFE